MEGEAETQPASVAKTLMLRLTIALAIGLFLFIGWACWVAFMAPQPGNPPASSDESRPMVSD